MRLVHAIYTLRAGRKTSLFIHAIYALRARRNIIYFIHAIYAPRASQKIILHELSTPYGLVEKLFFYNLKHTWGFPQYRDHTYISTYLGAPPRYKVSTYRLDPHRLPIKARRLSATAALASAMTSSGIHDISGISLF